MEETWKPIAAGVLEIVSGAVGIFAVIGLSVAIGVMEELHLHEMADMTVFVPSVLTSIAVPLAILSFLSLAGGIYALQRKLWGLALAGSISAIFCSIPLLGGLPVGITATIFIALSRNEFE